jgi:hypothetical protein
LDATLALAATVRDQNGQSFSGTINRSSDDPSVVTVDASGLLTAVQNGTATVTASSGNASATVAVIVQQAAAVLAVVSGGGQSATVGQMLPEVVVVRATNSGSTVVADVSLSFIVSSGGGTVAASAVATDDQGLASMTWTLGTSAGPQQVDVSVSGSRINLECWSKKSAQAASQSSGLLAARRR